MDFSLNDEHIALRDAVRRFCDGEYPAHRRGDAETNGEASTRWAAMADLGLLGLPLAADVGGSEQGPTEMMLVAQELGRALGGGAWLSSVVLAGQLLDQAGTPAQRQQWLPALAAGQARLALAIHEADARYDLSRVSTLARAVGDGWMLDGAKTLVLDGAQADAFIVAARTAGETTDEQGVTLFVIPAGAPGCPCGISARLTAAARRTSRCAQSAQVQTRCWASQAPHCPRSSPRPTAQRRVVRGSRGRAGSTAGPDHGAVEDAQAVRHAAREFQVLQHRVADMLIALEQCKSMACVAAVAVADGDLCSAGGWCPLPR